MWELYKSGLKGSLFFFFAFWLNSRPQITRTFKGNWKKGQVIGSLKQIAGSKKKNQFLLYSKRSNHIFIIEMPGSKLMLANSENATDFENLWVRKISTYKRLRVRVIHVSQQLFKKGKEFASDLTSLQEEKMFLAKLCKCRKKFNFERWLQKCF